MGFTSAASRFKSAGSAAMMFREDTVVRVVTLDAVEGKSVLLREVVEDPAWAAAVDASAEVDVAEGNIQRARTRGEETAGADDDPARHIKITARHGRHRHGRRPDGSGKRPGGRRFVGFLQ